MSTVHRRPQQGGGARRAAQRSDRGAGGARGDGSSSGRGSSDLVPRVAVALPAIAYAIFIINSGGWVFALGVLVLGWIAVGELAFAMRRARPPVAAAVAAVTAAVVAARTAGAEAVAVCVAAVLPLAFAALAARRDRRYAAWGVAAAALATVWIGVPLAYAVLLRDLDHGAGLIVDILIGTFLGDTAAYFGGRAFGATPLAPRISPNKTVEGFVCGVAGGTLAVWFAGLYQDWLSGTDALLLGAAVAIAAPLGDLFESLLKRDLGVKDLGRAFGAHGGVLDRLDAALFAIVVGYYVALALGFR